MTWDELFMDESQKPYFQTLMANVTSEYKSSQCFPAFGDIMRAFALTPYDSVKCVIVGQDPYHTPGQAMGLAFATPKGRPMQPSVQNIFKELNTELGVPVPAHGDLTPWASRGVLLLNSVLTVRAHSPASHQNMGWEKYTDAVLKALDAKPGPLVFMLWGRYARDKARFLGSSPASKDHLVLEAAHPSPYSAANGFFGCGHFRKCNQFLAGHGADPIDWRLD